VSSDLVKLPGAETPDFETTEEMPGNAGAANSTASIDQPKASPATFPYTDLGNAERLVASHGRDLLHTPSHGWLAWDGKRWTKDETGEVMRRAKETVRAMYMEAVVMKDAAACGALAKHAIKSEDCRRLHAMVTLAESEANVATCTSRLDSDPWQLNVDNGTIDLRTGHLHAHERTDYITKIAPVPFDPSAPCPRWEQFLVEVQPDPAVRAYLKRLAGYSATGVIRDHVLPVNYGGGRNGKGVFSNALQRVLGDYARTLPTEVLMAKKVDDHPAGRAELFGCRLAVASETEQNRAFSVALVKLLTGGDPISARFMRENFFTFTPTHKLMLSTNHRPVIRETKDAIWDRVHLIPWLQRFPVDKQDKLLGEKLQSEAPGILRWLVEGCLEWQRMGLTPPPTVVAATAQYRKDMDLLGDFLSECCVLEPTARVSRPTLRRAYEAWAEEIGQKNTLDPKGFADALRERGCVEISSMREDGRATPVRGWEGVRLRTERDGGTYPGVDPNSGVASKEEARDQGTPEAASTADYVSTSGGACGVPAPPPIPVTEVAPPPDGREEFEL
jgi:putative DNA primase/helicase